MALHRSYQGHKAEAIRDYCKALNLFTRLGDERGQAQTYECMTYIGPEDSSGTVSAAQRLRWAIAASRLYRKVGNPRGGMDAIGMLALIPRLTPVARDTRLSLEQVEDECRLWLRIEGERLDVLRLRALWIAMAETALNLGDKHVMSEALPALLTTAQPGNPHDEYHWRIVGAYRRYRFLDLHRERSSAWFNQMISTSAISPTELSRRISCQPRRPAI